MRVTPAALATLDNTLRVAAVEARPARIHQHRFAGRSNEERGLPALHVNEVHVEGARRPQRRAEKCQESNQEEFAHGVHPNTICRRRGNWRCAIGPAWLGRYAWATAMHATIAPRAIAAKIGRMTRRSAGPPRTAAIPPFTRVFVAPAKQN